VDYIKDGKRIGLPIPLHEGRLRGRRRMGQKSFADRYYNSVSETHFSVLQQLKIAAPYIEEHLSELHRDNIGRTEAWIMKEYRCVFTTWLMGKMIPTKDMMMKMMASRPSSCEHHGKHMKLMGTLITLKKKIRRVLPKIMAFVLRLLIHKD
jgi:hypothetical protein